MSNVELLKKNLRSEIFWIYNCALVLGSYIAFEDIDVRWMGGSKTGLLPFLGKMFVSWAK